MTFIRIIVIYKTTLNQIIVTYKIYKTTFIPAIAVYTRQCIIQRSTVLHTQSRFTYIHGVVSLVLFPTSPCCPSLTPFELFSTYLRPPAVTGIVLPLLRLFVNWPYLPPPLNPIIPPSPTSHNPNCPTPDNDDIGTAPLWLCGTVLMKISVHFVNIVLRDL